MEETQETPEKPKKKVTFAEVTQEISRAGLLGAARALVGDRFTRLQEEATREAEREAEYNAIVSQLTEDTRRVLTLPGPDEVVSSAGALPPNIGEGPVSRASSIRQLREAGISMPNIMQAARNSGDLMDSLAREIEALTRVERTGVSPGRCRFLERYTPDLALKKIVKQRLTPYTSSQENAYGLPKQVLKRIAGKSGASNYLPEEIAWMFLDWYFLGKGTLKFEGLPVDVTLEIIALHVEKGYDPPWVDKGFSENLTRFSWEVKTSALSPNRPLSATGRALYEIFLAWAYPALADPMIVILPGKPVEKPYEPEKPVKRGRRKLDVSPVDSGEFRQGRGNPYTEVTHD